MVELKYSRNSINLLLKYTWSFLLFDLRLLHLLYQALANQRFSVDVKIVGETEYSLLKPP